MCCQMIREVHTIWVIDRPNGCECVAVCMCVPCTNSGVVIRFAVTFIWVSLDGVWRMVCHSFSPELLKKVDGTSILCVCVHACVCVHLYCYSNNNRWHKHSMGSSKPIAVGSTQVTADRCMMLINSLLWFLVIWASWLRKGHPKVHFYGGTDQEHALSFSKAQFSTIECRHHG